MTDQEQQLDLRRLLLGTLGATLLVAGLAVAIWAVTVINDALYTPAEIPLLEVITESLGGEAGALDITTDGSSLSRIRPASPAPQSAASSTGQLPRGLAS